MSLFARARAGLKVRLATEADAVPLLEFLERDPAANVFLSHLVRRDGLGENARFRAWHVATRDGAVRGACMASSNIVPAAEDEAVARELAAGIVPVRPGTQSLVGERAMVNAMWESLHRHAPAVRLVREEQPFYRMDRGAGVCPQASASAGAFGRGPGRVTPLTLRFARSDDLDLMVDASADMLREEILDDPYARDPVGFRAQVWRMIREGSVWVGEAGGRVVFKAHANVRTPQAIQVSGVYTLPEHRGRGYATGGMAELARRLLREHGSVCLYVNNENGAAIRAYEAAGFRRSGTFKSVFFESRG